MSRDVNRPRVILAIDTEDGLTGWGECYNHGPDRALPEILDYMALFLSGEDPRRVEYLTLKLRQQARFPMGALGLAALSAVDHALWDISAKALGVPVYQLLGGRVRDKVKVYQGIYTAPDVPLARDQIAGLNARFGLTAFKLSPFRIDPLANRWGEVVRTSADYFGALRAALPSDHEIAFDAHGRIFEVWQAAQLGNALAPYDPLFYEEPMRPEHIPAWAELKAKLTCPLATGESLYSRHEFQALFAARGTDIAQPDICVVGGMTEMRRIAVLAEVHGVTMAPHNPMGPLATAVNLHFCLSTWNARILEYRLPHGAYMDHASEEEGHYVADPYLPVGGHLLPREDRPGWGVIMDEAFLASDRYLHWERKVPRFPDGALGYP